MADFLQLVSMLREQMNATLSRSDVLKPLAWLIGILAALTAVLAAAKAPEWLLVWAAGSLVCTIVLYGAAYTFCLLKDRDALRSERYTLHKMAIEHGVYGDSRIGLIEPDPNTPKLIEPSKEEGSVNQ